MEAFGGDGWLAAIASDLRAMAAPDPHADIQRTML